MELTDGGTDRAARAREVRDALRRLAGLIAREVVAELTGRQSGGRRPRDPAAGRGTPPTVRRPRRP